MSVSTKQLDKILDSHDQAMQALATADKKKTAELKSHFADLDDLLGRMAKKRGQDGDIVAEALAEIGKKDSERAARLSKIVGSSKKKDEVEKFNPHHVPAGTPDGGQFTNAAAGGGISSTSRGVNKALAKEIDDNQDKLQPVGEETINPTHKYTAEDGTEFHIKEVLGRDELERELAAKQLAVEMGVGNKVPDISDITGDDEIPRVASEWTEGTSFHELPKFSQSAAMDRMSQEEHTRIMAYEYMLANDDRHSGNVMQSSTGSVILIDNGNAFRLDLRDAANDEHSAVGNVMNKSRNVDVAVLREISSNSSSLSNIANGINNSTAKQSFNNRITAFDKAVNAIDSDNITHQEFMQLVVDSS